MHIVVRGDGLAETMSRYLARRIEDNPAIELHTRTEVTAVTGDTHVAAVRWRNNVTGRIEEREVRHLFIMAGALPNTA